MFHNKEWTTNEKKKKIYSLYYLLMMFRSIVSVLSLMNLGRFRLNTSSHSRVFELVRDVDDDVDDY